MNLIILILILSIIRGYDHCPTSSSETKITDESKYVQDDRFPDDFLFGAATSAYQSEGAWNVSNKGESIWDKLTHENPSIMRDETNADTAANSYYLYKTDVDLVKQLGANSYRISLSWPRILPTGSSNYVNEDGIRYYNDLIDEMLKKNITPYVTIYYWDLPANLEELGGWTNPLIVDWFVDYARVVFNAFGAKVKFWATFNEPMLNCYYSYNGGWPPRKNQSGIGDYLCIHHTLLAHAKTYQLYNENFRETQKGEISLVLMLFETIPDNPNDPEEVKANEFYSKFRNDWVLHPIFSKEGDYSKIMKDRIAKNSLIQGFPQSRLPEFKKEEIELIKNSVDFLAISYYVALSVTKLENLDVKETITGDADAGGRHHFSPSDSAFTGYKSTCSVGYCHPWGLSKLIQRITNKYNIPKIMIAANGYTDFYDSLGLNDIDRAEYHYYHLKELLKLRKEGINIRGYFAWSLFDVIEWYRGHTCNYGIYAVNFTDPQRTRTPKNWSPKLLKEIYTTKTIPPCFCSFVNKNKNV